VTAARTRAAPGRFPFITTLFTDAAYAGDRAAKATCIRLEIIGRPKGKNRHRRAAQALGRGKGPWPGLNRHRRLAKDFERSVASAEAFLYAAVVMLLVPRSSHNAHSPQRAVRPFRLGVGAQIRRLLRHGRCGERLHAVEQLPPQKALQCPADGVPDWLGV
jgi:hypothetical protein